MTGPDEATVKNFVEYLQDCMLWEDSHEGYEAIRGEAYLELKRRVEELQAWYPPFNQLPGVGQDLWRELQAGVATITATNQVPFFRALDGFLSWLATHYGLAPREHEPSAEPTHKTHSGAGRKRKAKRRKVNAFMLRAALAMHHFPEGRESVTDPITEVALADLLGCSQATVSRLMKEVFPKVGGKVYRNACRTGAIKGLKRKFADRTETADGVVDEDEE